VYKKGKSHSIEKKHAADSKWRKLLRRNQKDNGKGRLKLHRFVQEKREERSGGMDLEEKEGMMSG